MEFKETTISSEYIYKGKVINLKKDKVKLPFNKEGVREIIEHNGGSAILCVNESKVLLVRQFRYAFNQSIYEIPAGKINSGENPLDTAFRELEEECGIKAKKMQFIYQLYPSPGYTKEIIYLYKAEDIEKSATHFDEDEFIESFWVDIDKAKEMVKKGEIVDAKTVIAISLL